MEVRGECGRVHGRRACVVAPRVAWWASWGWWARGLRRGRTARLPLLGHRIRVGAFGAKGAVVGQKAIHMRVIMCCV